MSLTVISTRILPSEAAEKIRQWGMHLIEHDFIEKRFTDAQDLTELKLLPHVVLTSVAGVLAFINVVNKHGLNKDKFQIYCIEQETCAEALRQGLRVIGTAGTASLLADVIITHRSVRAVTFVCSNIRRNELPEKLRAADRTVHEWIGYSVTANPLRVKEGPFLLFFSPSGIDSFRLLNTPETFEAVCIGETTAAHARLSGFTKVYSSDKSTVESVVSKVIEVSSNKI
jgi:uroporphyrinogen-III synthase